ncbi:MAG: DUF3083 family protein [Colwellia sp.]|nr:DUF3083 family protein [Colwellia sp.]
MSIIRKRSAAPKAYIPNNARDNQYIIAQFSLTDELLNKLTPQWTNQESQKYLALYQKLSQSFFDLCQQFEIDNGLFIANDKLARVRYSNEMYQWQTNQQILFYYNPSIHQLTKTFYDGDVRAKKVNLLFLASGEDIRLNSARFHAKINQLLTALFKGIDLDSLMVRLRDHQHLTYDLFAKQKGSSESVAHKLRQVTNRYASQQVSLPLDHKEITYTVVTIPVTNALLNLADIDPQSPDPYNPLYTMITDAFTVASKHFNLNNGTLIANGLVPIVRLSINESIVKEGELQMLGYNPENTQCGMVSKWDANQLVDQVQVIFVAQQNEKHEAGYARFLNHIEQALRLMVTELELIPEKDQITVRFHQHIAYNI